MALVQPDEKFNFSLFLVQFGCIGGWAEVILRRAAANCWEETGLRKGHWTPIEPGGGVLPVVSPSSLSHIVHPTSPKIEYKKQILHLLTSSSCRSV